MAEFVVVVTSENQEVTDTITTTPEWRAAMAEVYALVAEICDAEGFSSGGRGMCYSDLPTPGDPPHSFDISIGSTSLSVISR